MHEFKINLLYNEEQMFCTKIEFLNFKIILPFPKLDITGARLESNGILSSRDIPVKIHVVTFPLLLLKVS